MNIVSLRLPSPVKQRMTNIFHIPARGFTSAYINPSLAYGLTFHCPGFTFIEYAVVYWLGSLTGKIHYIKIKHMFLFSSYSKCLFSRHDYVPFVVHGSYSEDLCQKPTIFAEDTFQSAKRRKSRKEENVMTLLIILDIWSVSKRSRQHTVPVQTM